MVQRLVLWDIDGTLLRAGVAGAEIFDRAVEEALGRPLDPAVAVAMSGKTDPQIVREYLHLLGEPETDDTILAVLRRLEQGLAAIAGELTTTGRVCPGVVDVLARLDADGRVVNSVLTGNIAPNAVIKLRAFDLDRWLDLSVGAFGSDHHQRNELVPIAIGRLAEERGTRVEPADVWVIGDTPLDLACARAAGARCLLVATGRTGVDELGALGADAVLADLTDTDGVVKLLTGDLDPGPSSARHGAG
ncbi:MAG TPA: haloacid dehalogenase-like hydrolase [Acidimicrobiales bacterium]|nr:haloacid dehalogenase-like hydrolase [Acidimicrobiales bacterium]